MASLNQVSIEIQVKGEREATQALKRYSDASDKLNRSVLNAASKIESTTNAWDRANKLYEKGVLNAKALQAAQTQLARELAVLNGYTKTNGALNTQRALAELRAAQATREATQEARNKAAAEAAAAQSYRQLKMAIDPAYAAQQRLTQSVRTIREAQRAGVITTQEAIAALRQLRAAQDAAAQGSQFASRGLNRMGVVAQQAGYQVGDFFVQIQSGTNAMVAFGQQATQLVGTFAMFAKTTRAAVIASGIGIFISIATAVGAAIMRMNGQMDTLDTKVQKMTSSFDDLNTSMDRLEDTDLDETFGNLTDEVESITEAMVELNNAAALNNLMATFEKLEGVADAGFFRNLGEGFLNIGRVINPFAQGEGLFGIVTPEQLDREAFEKLGYDMSRAQYLAYLEGLQQLASQGDIEGVTSLIAQFFQDATDGAAEVSMEGISIAQSMETAALQAAEFAARQNGSAEAAKLLREQIEAQAEAERLLAEENAKYAEAQDEANQKLKELTAEISASHQAYIPLGLAAQEAKDATEKHVSEMAELFKNAQDLRTELGDAAYEALRLAGVDMASGVNAAAKAAAQLAADLNISLAAALAMQSMSSKEEQVMSQPVVTGKVTDRFGTEDLLRMGYTEDYLKFIGKIRSSGGTSGGGAGVDPAEEFRKAKEAVDQLRASYDEQYATSLKVQEAQQKINKAMELGVYTQEQGKEALDNYIASLQKTDDTMADFVNDSAQQMSDALMSIIDGSKSASDAFGDMARAILKQALQLAVINPIINGIFGGVPGFNKLPSLFADGAAFRSGNIIPFANGGVVSSPTLFPMRGAQTGLMGEAGPEAIMPLKRGKGGKLGVVADGASQPIVINQSFNFSANGDESVKRIIAQEAPKIANLTQKQIIEQRQRGGTMKSVFS